MAAEMFLDVAFGHCDNKSRKRLAHHFSKVTPKAPVRWPPEALFHVGSIPHEHTRGQSTWDSEDQRSD